MMSCLLSLHQSPSEMGSTLKGRAKSFLLEYSKYPKISNTKVSDKMTHANSADPDQTAPEGTVCSGSTLFAFTLSISRNDCIRSKI